MNVTKNGATMMFNATLACAEPIDIDTELGFKIRLEPNSVFPCIEMIEELNVITTYIPIGNFNVVYNCVCRGETYQIDICSDPMMFKPTITIWWKE